MYKYIEYVIVIGVTPNRGLGRLTPAWFFSKRCEWNTTMILLHVYLLRILSDIRNRRNAMIFFRKFRMKNKNKNPFSNKTLISCHKLVN